MPAKKTAAKKTAKSTPEVEKPAVNSKASNGKVAAFTLVDVQSLLKAKKPEETVKETKKVAKKKVVEEIEEIPQETQNLGAASLADILGFDPTASNGRKNDETKVPKKFKVYYDLFRRFLNCSECLLFLTSFGFNGHFI